MKVPTVAKLPKSNSMDKLLKFQVWIRRIIAFLFCSVLIALSASIIQDLEKTEHTYTVADYSSVEYKNITDELSSLRALQNTLYMQNQKVNDELNSLRRQRTSFEEEYKSWMALRSVTESKETNPEVRERLNTLDNTRNQERELEKAVHVSDQEYKALSLQIEAKQNDLNKLTFEFQQKADEANRSASIKVFFFRLMFCLPILALGVFSFIKYRNHQYSPLVWGYIWFSVYIFFFGLVPYLPSFGGYIRHVVGLLLILFGGIYAIRGFNNYMERRKIELEKDKNTRAKEVDSENAVLAYKTHICPSCGQDYSISGNVNDPDHKIRNCFHCGLELFKVCECGKLNFAFFKFCSCCGKNIKEIKD